MRRTIATAVLCVFLAGCGSDGLDDLREFVNNAHADRKPKVEPLPAIKPYESFLYSASGMTDPFSVSNLRPLSAGTGTGPRPDLNRRKEALEDYPLDGLKMVGTVSRETKTWAIVKAPDGSVHWAQVGNYMGQNFGRVVKISEAKVDLVEQIPGSLGEWIEREASLAIVE